MASLPVLSQTLAGVTTITLDWPERRNAFGQPLITGLLDALDGAITDEATRVIVLTNTGTTFSAGADLKEDRASLPADAFTFVNITDRIAMSPKPVIGRIAGHAAGGGAALAAMCDFAIASEDVRIGITEVRIGIPPAGVADLLVHRLSPRAATEAFLTGEMMSASRAADLGLINRAVPADQLDAEVGAVVESLVRSAPKAIAATKRLLAEMRELSTSQTRRHGQLFSAGLFDSNEAKEGVSAFLEKRDPAWLPKS